jgi:hypothetical protein
VGVCIFSRGACPFEKQSHFLGGVVHMHFCTVFEGVEKHVLAHPGFFILQV